MADRRKKRLNQALDAFMGEGMQAPAQDTAQPPAQVPPGQEQARTAQETASAQAPAQDAAQYTIPRRPERKVRLHCWIPEGLKTYITDTARELGVSEAEVVRHMVAFYQAHGPLRKTGEK